MLKNYIFVMVLFLAGYLPAYRFAKRPLQRLMGARYIGAYAVTIAAGFFAPNIWIYHFVVIASFLATVTDRQDAICRYAVMLGLIPFVNTVMIVGSFYVSTFSAIASLSIAMLIATFVKPNRGGIRPQGGWTMEDSLVLVVFLIFTVGASRFGAITSLLRSMFMALVDLVLPYYLIRRNVRTPEDMQRLIGCIAISAASLAVIGIYESRMSWPLFDAISSRLSMVYGLASSTFRRGNALRAIASLGNPLVFAYYLMIGSLAWLCSRDLFRSDLVWRGGIVLFAVGLTAPQSRGVFVAILPAIIVLLVTRRRFAAAAGLLAASGIGGAALFALQNTSSAIGAFVGGTRAGQYYDYRGLLLHRGMQEGWKHPIFGQSIENATLALADITQGEHIVDFVNTYLNIFLISGLVGITAYAVLATGVVRKLIARARRGETLVATRSNRSFVLALLTGIYIYIYSVSFGDRIQVYFVVMLALARSASAQLIRRAPRRQVPLSPPVLEDDRFKERLVPA